MIEILDRFWVLVVVAAVLTFGLRVSVVEMFERVDSPPVVERALDFLPPAIFTGLVVSTLFSTSGTSIIVYEPGQLVAAGIAAVVAWRYGTLSLAILTGMVALWVWTFLGL
jgi:branched-subunit amino acid transport protein